MEQDDDLAEVLDRASGVPPGIGDRECVRGLIARRRTRRRGILAGGSAAVIYAVVSIVALNLHRPGPSPVVVAAVGPEGTNKPRVAAARTTADGDVITTELLSRDRQVVRIAGEELVASANNQPLLGSPDDVPPGAGTAIAVTGSLLTDLDGDRSLSVLVIHVSPDAHGVASVRSRDGRSGPVLDAMEPVDGRAVLAFRSGPFSTIDHHLVMVEAVDQAGEVVSSIQVQTAAHQTPPCYSAAAEGLDGDAPPTTSPVATETSPAESPPMTTPNGPRSVAAASDTPPSPGAVGPSEEAPTLYALCEDAP